ncbi:universal stress protein [Marinobacterium arenosum]|uniref:universal stress protein n=1 Tax=Marinobacterium arenosum TaxID=2862496 RepID=UPI001C95180D|nr:universal stress protein [Marinobacterium arenosum]MBY4677789.1 universal stress protein [Marinobacterium arenosum]
MFERILVHVDPMPDHDVLVDKLIQLAGRFNAQVELFDCCFNRSLKQSYMFDHAAEVHAEHGYVKQIEERLESMASALEKAGIKVGVDACWQKKQAHGIVQKALRYEADLVVVELAPHTLLQRLFGEMEAELVRLCPMPLLLAKEHRWREQPLVAVGLDPFHQSEVPVSLDQQLLSVTAKLAAGFGVVPEVLHSIHSLPHSAIFDEHVVTDYEALKDKVNREHRTVVSEFVAGSELPPETGLNFLSGECHVSLPRYAAERNLDILVLGEADRDMVDRLLLGSTVRRVMDKISCDLLVVKQPDFVSPVAAIG